MQRAASLREWSQQSTSLWLKLNAIQSQWRLLAGQYVGLPLAFRRDMTLGKWSERFICATILEHIAAHPAILNDPNVYRSQQLSETFDMLLSETETCLVSRGWYAMLHEAASTMRHWDEVSDNTINPQRIVDLLNQGEAAVGAMKVMLQTLTSTYGSAQATPRPDRMMTRAWNSMCSDIRWGAELENAASKFTWEAPDPSQSTSRPVSNGGRRVWNDFEENDPSAERTGPQASHASSQPSTKTATPSNGASVWRSYNERWGNLPANSKEFPYPSSTLRLPQLTAHNFLNSRSAAKYNAAHFFSRHLSLDITIDRSAKNIELGATQDSRIVETARQHLKKERLRWHPDTMNRRTGSTELPVDTSIAEQEELKGIWDAVSGLQEACQAFLG